MNAQSFKAPSIEVSRQQPTSSKKPQALMQIGVNEQHHGASVHSSLQDSPVVLRKTKRVGGGGTQRERSKVAFDQSPGSGRQNTQINKPKPDHSLKNRQH